MFFILATAAFFAAIVLLLVYTTQISRTKRNYLGRNAVKKITEQAVESSLKKETWLTCDYCGCVIDTTRYKTCPQCGATYGEDREWKSRIGVNRKQMEELIDSGIGIHRDKVRALNAGRMKKARTLLTALGIVTAFFVAMMVIGLTAAAKERNRSEQIGSDYQPAGYSFTEKLIGDSGGLRVELGDIYVKQDDFWGETETSYGIEVRISNPEKKKGSLAMYLAAANGKCFDSIFYEDIGPKSEIVRILEIPYYYFGEDTLKTLVIYDAHFSGDDYNDSADLQKEARVFETDADHIVQEPQIKGDILLENGGLTFSVYSESEKTYFQITNTGADDFQIVTYTPDLRSDYDGMWVNVFVPAGCQYNDEVPPPDADADRTLQLECTCRSRPELSFITSLMRISD